MGEGALRRFLVKHRPAAAEDLSALQEAHDRMWRRVADRLRSGERLADEHDLITLKQNVLIELFEEGVLDEEMYSCIDNSYSCVLCALYTCLDCPLKRKTGLWCNEERSLYKKVLAAEGLSEAVAAAEAIRDTDVLSGEYLVDSRLYDRLLAGAGASGSAEL